MTGAWGKFRLLDLIGGGRLSQVFRVTRLEGTGRPAPGVALKRVLPALIGEPAFVHLVAREAGLLGRLAHPRLCRLQEAGVVDGCAFFTLDFVEGCTLRALMRHLSQREARLPASVALALGHELAGVLCYLHEECETPLVHLDLSPQNVMVTNDGELKLIDFGIARRLDGRDPPPLGEKIAGTVGYMSPEQARGESVDSRADQFGLGILLWELLAGQRAFRGNTPETWRRMRRGELPVDRHALDEAPEPLAKLVKRLLRPAAGDRFATTRGVLEGLERASSDPSSGKRPLAVLVQKLLADPGFNPFDLGHGAASTGGPDAIRPGAATSAQASVEEIPTGARGQALEYAELAIEVERGAGTPAALLRAELPERSGVPSSPFLETIPEAQATATIAE